MPKNSISDRWDAIWLKNNQYSLYPRRVFKTEEKISDLVNFGINFLGKKVLDAGCGDGAALRYLQQNFQTTGCGVDISSGAIERAKTIESTNMNTYQVADARALPFSDKTFDVVLSWGVLTYFDELEQAISEARRVLKPDGLLLIVQPNLLSFGVMQEWYLRLKKRWLYGIHKKHTPFKFSRILKRSGFSSVKFFAKPPYADMPIAGIFDRILNRVFPFWGHYLYIIARL